MEHLKLTHDKLSVEDISELVASPTCGAISIFMGTTRDNFEGKTVVNLEYEVYEAMAMKLLQNICLDMRNQWPAIENIAIYHRLGTVPVKEASIVIAVSSPHRGDAMQATQWCIDNVKKTVPIWKKEVYVENSSEWKENKESSTYPPRIRLFKLDNKPEVKVPFVPPHLIQIKADSEEIERRIEKFIERKREEINQSNIRDFCSWENNENSDSSCARVDAKLVKRKDSKGHLQVNRVLNSYHRDQGNLEYLKSYNPKNGIEERLQNIEIQLSLDKAVNKNIYYRLKNAEDRLLYLESISPEYLQFWVYGRLNLVVKRFYLCDLQTNYPIKIYASICNTDNNIQYVEANATLRVPFDNDIKGVFTIDMLVGKTYVQIIKIEEKHACSSLHRYFGEFAYDLERTAQLVPGLCPIPQGRYHVHNYPLHFETVTTQNIPFGHLRFRTTGTDKNHNLLFCFVGEVENVS